MCINFSRSIFARLVESIHLFGLIVVLFDGLLVAVGREHCFGGLLHVSQIVDLLLSPQYFVIAVGDEPKKSHFVITILVGPLNIVQVIANLIQPV